MSSLEFGPCVQPGVRTLCRARGPDPVSSPGSMVDLAPCPAPADQAPGPALVDPARPRRIQPQVLTSNFLLALVPGVRTRAGQRVRTPSWTQGLDPRLDTGSDPGLDTGSGPQAGHRVRTPGWTLQEQDYIFASHFFNNGSILINLDEFNEFLIENRKNSIDPVQKVQCRNIPRQHPFH